MQETLIFCKKRHELDSSSLDLFPHKSVMQTIVSLVSAKRLTASFL
jgi:hypothetical protein